MAKIESLRLEPADNGFTICWTECEYAQQGTYGNAQYTSREEVFKDSESKKAMSRFMELRNKMKGIKSESTEEETKEGEGNY